MKKILLLLFMVSSMITNAQFTKEKLHDVLSGPEKKSWSVSGVNVERPEKVMTFKKDYSGEVENQAGVKKKVKWELQSSDNIRWFMTFGEMKYEMIVSYNKKGEQYVKLTSHTPGNEFEMKLNQIK